MPIIIPGIPDIPDAGLVTDAGAANPDPAGAGALAVVAVAEAPRPFSVAGADNEAGDVDFVVFTDFA